MAGAPTVMAAFGMAILACLPLGQRTPPN